MILSFQNEKFNDLDVTSGVQVSFKMNSSMIFCSIHKSKKVTILCNSLLGKLSFYSTMSKRCIRLKKSPVESKTILSRSEPGRAAGELQ